MQCMGHVNTSIENIVYTEFTKKKVFELFTVGAGSPAHCDLTSRRVMVDLLPVRSHSGIDTFCLP